MKTNKHHERVSDATSSLGDGDTESLRDKESECQSKGVVDDTHDTDERPPLAARVASLPEAVQLSLAEGVGENCLFTYARALKAFEVTTGLLLSPKEVVNAFSLWWVTAKAKLPADAEIDEWRFVFEDAFAKARSPLGANPLEEAIHRANAVPNVPHVSRYTSPRIRRLIAVCHHLQALAGEAPFFLSLRDAARIADNATLRHTATLMDGLVRDGVLILVEKGKPGGSRASRFKFIPT